jgi:hypothetical protein
MCQFMHVLQKVVSQRLQRDLADVDRILRVPGCYVQLALHVASQVFALSVRGCWSY